MAIEENSEANDKMAYKEKSFNFMHIHRNHAKYFGTTKKRITSN